MLRRELAISLLLHGVLAVCLVLWLRAIPESARVTAPPGSRPGAFQFMLEDAGKAAPSSGNTAEKRDSRVRHPRELQLGDLGLARRQGEAESPGSDAGGGAQGAAQGSGGRGEGYDLAATGDPQAEARLYPFFRALWHRVNAVLGYPDELVKERVEGAVDLRLLVDRRGVFNGAFLNASAEEPLLKAYAMAIVVHALREPLPESAWGDHDSLVLGLRLEFGVLGVGQAPAERNASHFRNVLSFRRQVFDEPKLNQAINRFFNRYVPPIIPIPGGFYIDFIRAYEMARDWNAPDPDELRGARLELMKEKWVRTIRRAEER